MSIAVFVDLMYVVLKASSALSTVEINAHLTYKLVYAHHYIVLSCTRELVTVGPVRLTIQRVYKWSRSQHESRILRIVYPG